MNKSASILALLLLVTLGSLYLNNTQKIDRFQQWQKDFGVKLDESERFYRRIIFEKNLQMVEKHNADDTQTYEMGINQFSIYTKEQFSARFLGLNLERKSEQTLIEDNFVPNVEIDWTTKSGVSRVKNQGQCGSCWAFSSTGVSQSWALIFKKTSHDLSQQQLVDCSGSYGNHGCNGGSRQGGLRYVRDHGLVTESEYPYKAVNQACKKNEGSFKIPSIKTTSGCAGLQSEISGRPLAVAVNANGWSHYSSGVFNNCGTSIDHAVLLVGVVNGAWKIKNSWGTSWGQKGFIRLSSGNTCGVCSEGGVFIQ